MASLSEVTVATTPAAMTFAPLCTTNQCGTAGKKKTNRLPPQIQKAPVANSKSLLQIRIPSLPTLKRSGCKKLHERQLRRCPHRDEREVHSGTCFSNHLTRRQENQNGLERASFFSLRLDVGMDLCARSGSTLSVKTKRRGFQFYKLIIAVLYEPASPHMSDRGHG